MKAINLFWLLLFVFRGGWAPRFYFTEGSKGKNHASLDPPRKIKKSPLGEASAHPFLLKEREGETLVTICLKNIGDFTIFLFKFPFPLSWFPPRFLGGVLKTSPVACLMCATFGDFLVAKCVGGLSFLFRNAIRNALPYRFVRGTIYQCSADRGPE